MKERNRKLSIEGGLVIRKNPSRQSYLQSDVEALRSDNRLNINPKRSLRPSSGSQFLMDGQLSRSNQPKGSIISQRNQAKGTIVSSSNSSKHNKDSLFMEYQDILKNEDQQSSSDESSDSMDTKRDKQKTKTIDMKYSKHQPQQQLQSELDHMTNTIKSRMSQISKGNLTQNSQKIVQMPSIVSQVSMKGTVKSSFMNKQKSNKSLHQSVHKKIRDRDVNQSFQEQQSVVTNNSQHRKLDYQGVLKLLESSSITEEERKKYIQLLEELEKKCDEQEGPKRDRVRKKVRQTFVAIFAQMHGIRESQDRQFQQISDLESSYYSVAHNDSIILKNHEGAINSYKDQNMTVRHPETKKVSSILDNSFQTDDKKLKQFMEQFAAQMVEDDYDEMDDDSSEEEEPEPGEDGLVQSEDQSVIEDQDFKEATVQIMKKEIRKYQKKYKRDPKTDSYPLYWVSLKNFKWIMQEFQYYYDDKPLLKLRSLIVFIIRTINHVAYIIVTHKLFIISVLASIIFNTITFVQDQGSANAEHENDYYRDRKFLALYFFTIEIALKLLAYGPVNFLANFWNLVDSLIYILFIVHLQDQELLPIDFSTIRVIRLLLFMGLFIEKLQIMFVALSESIKFLGEAALILCIFTLFFALIGLHLFNGLFRLNCHEYELGIPTTTLCGYNQKCKAGYYCAYTANNPYVPSNFDTILYSYTQVIRVMIYNDWTDALYYSMRTFHDASLIFYILIIFILGIFGLNLIIAVMKIYYSATMHKYEHENILLKDVEEVAELNLMWLKQFNLDNFLYKQDPSPSNSKKKQTQNGRKTQAKQKKKFLSARQKREYEEKYNKDMGIKIFTYSWIDIIKKFSFDSLFITNQQERQFWVKINNNQEFQSHEHRYFYITSFKTNPFLSWQTCIKNDYEYTNTSEIDIFTDQTKKQQQVSRRKRELDFIAKATPKQFYVVQQRDINNFKRNIKKEQTFQSVRIQYKSHKVPIRSRNKGFQKQGTFRRTIKIFKPATLLQQQNINASGEGFGLENDIYQQSASIELNGIVEGVLYLNGVEQDYDHLRKLINKQFKEDVDDDLNEMEELYVRFRIEECKEGVIVKHNWSGDDIINLEMQSKTNFFKTLNKPDLIIWLTGLEGQYRMLQKTILRFLQNKSIETFFDFIVLLNIFILCMDGLVTYQPLDTINDIFMGLLLLELIAKVISQGIHRFCQKFQNIFDTLIILATISEIIINFIISKPSNQLLIFLNLMRACQGILFYRVIKYNKFAIQMIDITLKTFPSFCNLIILMLFLILVFALIGMNMFKDQFPLHTELGQAQSFEDLPKAFMTVFQRATMDDWYGLVIATTQYTEPTQALIYVLAMVYIINFMTFGLVLAIILEGFSDYEMEEEIDKKIQQINTEVSEDIKDRANEGISLNTQNSIEQESIQDDQVYELSQNQIGSNTQIQTTTVQGSTQILQTTQIPMEQQQQFLQHKFLDLQGNINRLAEEMFREFQYFSKGESQLSLYLFDQDNEVRKFLYKLVNKNLYRYIINLAILTSLLNMAVDTYVTYSIVISTLELLMNIVVFIDCILKIIAFGFALDKGAFTSELWRTIDFVYVVCYLIDQITPFSSFYTISFIRFLRPMRFVNMFHSLKQLNDALGKSLKDLTNIFGVQVMVWFIFAIFGVIIYRDKMGYCEEPMMFHVNQEQCEAKGKHWKVYVQNFDNIINSITTLYVVVACDGWSTIVQLCYNSNYANIGPEPLANSWITYIYFFLFVVIGSLFFMGFFTGILFATFQTNKSLIAESIYTEEQLQFIQVTEVIMTEVTQFSSPPDTFIRLLASDIISNSTYRKAMLPVIILNTAVLCLDYFGSELAYTRVLNRVYFGFSFALILDTFLKLLAYGLVRFWGYAWRKFELILTLITLFDFILDQATDWTTKYYTDTTDDNSFIYLRLLFALRNLRLLLIIQEFKGLSRLLRVLEFSGPFFFQILMFYMAILFSYGYAACQLYGQIDKGTYMDDYMNFTTFAKSILTLFKCSTRNLWKYVMLDCTNRNPYCATNPKYCGQNWILTNLFFYSYVLVSSFICLNLFVTAVVDQLEKFFHSQNSVLQTYIENIDHFRTIWCKYTPETKGRKLHTKYLAHFLLELGEPLGSRKGDNIWDAAQSASKFKIRADQLGYVHFQEVLYETVRFAYKEQTFHTGSQENIEAMKIYDKNTRYRLHYKRIDNFERRQSVHGLVLLKRNFNVMQEYIYVLTVFKTWSSYTQKLFDRTRKDLYEMDNQQSEPSQFSEKSDKGIQNHIQFHDLDTNKIDLMKRLPSEETQVQQLPVRYTMKRNMNKQRQNIKFFDDDKSEKPNDLEICALYCPQDPVNPQAPYDQLDAPIQRQGDRLKSLKSALKSRAQVEQDNQFMVLQSGSHLSAIGKLPNPMSEECDSGNLSIHENQLEDNPLKKTPTMRSEEQVGSESHHNLKIRKFQIKYKQGQRR